jgi:ribosomal protein L40E
MSSPFRVVPLLAIQHPRVHSNTSLVEICGRCRELIPMTVVTCHTRFLRPKPDAHRMYAQDQVVIHTVRM